MAEGGILAGIMPTSDPFSLLLIQILIIIVVCRLLAMGLRYFRQPTVIAEVVGGIILGPSVLGWIPGYMSTIFPPSSLPNLAMVANLGLIFYLFLVGLELDIGLMRAKFRASFLISLAGMVIPFAFAAGTAYLLYITYMSSSKFSFGVFYLFLGVAMSITAFPVLARILGELHLFSTPVGIQTISAAAVDDAAAWALLALVIGIVNATTPLNALYMVLMTAAFAAIMLFGVRRLLSILFRRGLSSDGTIHEWVVVVVLIVLLASSLITNIIGVHAIFGAFITGLAIPREFGFEVALTEKIEDLVTVLFLPLFFAFSGLRTNLGLLNDATAWGLVFLVIATACLGKIVGCTAASKFLKHNWRESLAIGILMNTKGLVELIVLNVGLDAKVINDQVFSIMVLMAVATTLMTTPLVTWIYPSSYYRKAVDDNDGKPEIQSLNDGLDKLFSVRIQPLICLPGLQFVPMMMKITKLLASETHDKNKTMQVHAARIIETSERTSSILKASHQLEAINEDMVLQVMKTFGRLNEIEIKPHISLTTLDEVAPDLCEIGDANSLNTIMIPWQHPRDKNIAIDYASGQQHHHTVVRNLLKKWDQSVAVVVERGIPALEDENNWNILVPFFGGPDDREAVQLALRLGNHPQASVHILHINLTYPFRTDSLEDLDPSSKELGDSNTIVPIQYTDEKDTALMDSIHALIKQMKANDSNVKAKEILIENVETSSTEPFAPLLTRLAQTQYALIVFGHLGTHWARNMSSNIEENQKTADAQMLRNLAQAVYGPDGSYNTHNTIRSLTMRPNVGNEESFRMNQLTSTSDILVDRTVAQSASAPHQMTADQFSSNLNSAFANLSKDAPYVASVLGETGEALWLGGVHSSVNMISVRKLPLDLTVLKHRLAQESKDS